MAEEYIKRSDAIEAINNRMQEYIDKAYAPVNGGFKEFEMFSNAALGCRASIDIIKQIPSANVQEIVQ